jgi:hypothetical protein
VTPKAAAVVPAATPAAPPVAIAPPVSLDAAVPPGAFIEAMREAARGIVAAAIDDALTPLRLALRDADVRAGRLEREILELRASERRLPVASAVARAEPPRAAEAFTGPMLSIPVALATDHPPPFSVAPAALDSATDRLSRLAHEPVDPSYFGEIADGQRRRRRVGVFVVFLLLLVVGGLAAAAMISQARGGL